jgi:hypothetical protein
MPGLFFVELQFGAAREPGVSLVVQCRFIDLRVRAF